MTGGCRTTAIKPAEDGNGIVLRVFNPCLEECPVQVEVPQPLALTAAWLTRMDETDLEQLAVEDNASRWRLRPRKSSHCGCT